MNASLSAGLLAGLLAGCSPEPSAPHGHGHDHTSDAAHAEETKTAQITVWGDRYELFIEHQLPVAGTAIRFVTHVTDIKTFEPRSAGSIRFVLRLGQEPPVEHIEKAPARAGIYEPMLTFPSSGDWDVTVAIPGDDGESTVPLPRVKVYVDAHEAEHTEIPPAPEGISFLKEQQWKIKMGTGVPGKKPLVERIVLPAQTARKPGLAATVIAPVAGQLLAPADAELPVPGQRIEAGQLLARLKPMFSDAAARIAEADAETMRSRAALQQAEAAYNRVRKLAAAEAKSERELEESNAALAAAKASYEAAAALQSTYKQAMEASVDRPTGMPALELRAPIGGIINSIGGGPGEPVTAGQPVFTVLDPSTLWIEAAVPEVEASRLATAKGAFYELPEAPGQFHDILASGGKLLFAGLQVDPATRTVPLIYEVNNRDARLRVGQSLTVHAETATVVDALAIPESAVVDEDGRPVAFVQISGETFEKRNLTLGIRDGTWLQVLDGLREGERIVTHRAYAVRLASVSSAIPVHGHVH